MTSYLFSPSTKGFYSKAIHGDIPADAVEISQGDYEKCAGRIVQPDENGQPVVVDQLAISFAELQVRLCLQIDKESDSARLAIAGDPLRVVEYERAAIEAQAYKDAGYSGTVPPTVKSWAEAKRWSGQQAADNILAEAAAWNQALYGIRDMRLKGKEAVRSSVDNAAAQAAADAVITQIRVAVVSVGNAK